MKLQNLKIKFLATKDLSELVTYSHLDVIAPSIVYKFTRTKLHAVVLPSFSHFSLFSSKILSQHVNSIPLLKFLSNKQF